MRPLAHVLAFVGLSGDSASGTVGVSQLAYDYGANYGPPGTFGPIVPGPWNNSVDFYSGVGFQFMTSGGQFLSVWDPLHVPAITLSDDRTYASLSGLLYGSVGDSYPSLSLAVQFSSTAAGLVSWSFSRSVFNGISFETQVYGGTGRFVIPAAQDEPRIPESGSTLPLLGFALLLIGALTCTPTVKQRPARTLCQARRSPLR
jgi:hypothetical protein